MSAMPPSLAYDGHLDEPEALDGRLYLSFIYPAEVTVESLNACFQL